MITGTYLKVPETGDRGNIWGPAVSDNFTVLDSHNHNGTNSPKVNAKDLTKSEITIASASFVLDAGGDYKNTVTLTAGYSFDTTNLKFMVTSGTYINKVINPTVNKVSATQFDVHIMTPMDIKVVLS